MKHTGHYHKSAYNIPKFNMDPRKIPDTMIQNIKITAVLQMNCFVKVCALRVLF